MSNRLSLLGFGLPIVLSGAFAKRDWASVAAFAIFWIGVFVLFGAIVPTLAAGVGAYFLVNLYIGLMVGVGNRH